MEVTNVPFLLPDHDVGQAVAVDVPGDDLRADAGVVVDEVGDEIDALAGAARA